MSGPHSAAVVSAYDVFVSLGMIFWGVLGVGWHHRVVEDYAKAYGRVGTRRELIIARIGLGMIMGPMLIGMGVLSLFGYIDPPSVVQDRMARWHAEPSW